MEKNNVLAVPAKALRFQPNDAFLKKGEIIEDCEGDHKLWTKEGNTFKAHKVEIGTSNGIMTEITGGIEAGTEVLTDFNISGGMPEQAQQGGNPFMPRPGNRNNNNNRGGAQGGNAAPPRQ
jgi:HlyD family secretion protein